MCIRDSSTSLTHLLDLLDGHPPAGSGPQLAESFRLRPGHNELPQASDSPAGPGLKVDDSFGLRPGHSALPQASANAAGPGLK
eukprot:5356498-Alexandrium_andersonii.AAC.1